jgi:hypothetical protein
MRDASRFQVLTNPSLAVHYGISVINKGKWPPAQADGVSSYEVR